MIKAAQNIPMLLNDGAQQKILQEYSREFGTFSNISDLFFKMKKEYVQRFSDHKSNLPEWYTVTGEVANFYELSEKLGEPTEYSYGYKYFSDYTHGSQIFDVVRNTGIHDYEKALLSSFCFHIVVMLQDQLLIQSRPYSSKEKPLHDIIVGLHNYPQSS